MMSTIEVINAGIFTGITHFGPDHLSALATVSGMDILSSQNHGRNHLDTSFLLGINWGIGHSLGLFVGVVMMMAMEEKEGIGTDGNVKFSMTFEWLVGVFTVSFGLYGFYKAILNTTTKTASYDNVGVESLNKSTTSPDEEMPEH